MSRDVAQDAIDITILLVAFLREATQRQARRIPLTQKHIEQSWRRVEAFKQARPGLNTGLVAQLDKAVQGMQEAFDGQQRRSQGHRRNL